MVEQSIEEHNTSHDATTTSNPDIAKNVSKDVTQLIWLVLQDHGNDFVLLVSHIE